MRKSNFRKIPFGEINTAVLNRLPELVEQWLPGGKRRGREYLSVNPNRKSDTKIGSFSVNTITGRWADFATEDRGGDVISLYAYIFNLRQGEAAKELAHKVGILIEKEAPARKRARPFVGMGRSSTSAAVAVTDGDAEHGEEVQPPRLQVVKTDLPKRFKPVDNGMPDEPVVERLVSPALPHERPEKGTRQKAGVMWKASEEHDHPLLEKYLGERGFFDLRWEQTLSMHDIKDIRLHQELEYWNPGEDEKPVCLGKFPAILAVVRDVNGRGVGLHRTYLQHDGTGKLNLPDPENPWDEDPLPAKKLLAFEAGVTRGAAIRLGQSDKLGSPRTLHVAEGIETTLAVMLVKGGDAWATVSAGGMAALEVPAWATEVVIWADKDVSKAGQNAADALAERLRAAGTHTEIRLPPGPIPDGKKGVDWLDILNQLGPGPFSQRGWMA